MEKNEVLISYGDDIESMALRLAQEAGLASLIGDSGKRIAIKPNLVVPRPASDGATTHPQIAAAIIQYLKKNGFNNIVIMEGSGVGDSTISAFNACGYSALADKYNVKLIDTKNDRTKTCDCRGMKIDICESALAVDFLINLPVMKGHCQTRLTCALKNNKGLIPDREKRRFHSIGLSKPIAHLNTVIKSGFIIVDGICGDLDFELGGNPVFSGRLIACLDPVLCDAWAANQMGYSVEDIPYIGIAEKLGIGSANLKNAKIRELNNSAANLNTAVPAGKIKTLASFIEQDNACSVCYSSLIYALSHTQKNTLAKLKEKIRIGQGYKKKTGNIGIGNCCKDFSLSCPGCPPSGLEILEFLRKNI
jgi:uncharacterized protein (DUF362 family)